MRLFGFLERSASNASCIGLVLVPFSDTVEQPRFFQRENCAHSEDCLELRDNVCVYSEELRDKVCFYSGIASIQEKF